MTGQVGRDCTQSTFSFLDRTCTLPPCRSAISFHTQSPVPTSFLRVKNPFQIFRSNAGAVIVPTQTRDRGAIFKGELFAVSVEELERFSYPGAEPMRPTRES
jgi:hypothetical protein